MLSTFTVGHIRTLYASGLYHKSDLYVRFQFNLKTPEVLVDILTYKIYPEIQEELRLPIFGLPYILEATEDYHNILRVTAMEEHEAILDNPVDAANHFTNVKREADKVLKNKLKFFNREFNTTFTLHDAQSRLYKDC